jgi:hypothetical protein
LQFTWIGDAGPQRSVPWHTFVQFRVDVLKLPLAGAPEDDVNAMFTVEFMWVSGFVVVAE